MASRSYSVGSVNPINIAVRTGTAAICSSSINLFFPNGQKKKISTAGAVNGSIPNSTIGNSSDLVGASIVIHTIADFRALPADVITAISTDPHALKTNLMIEYIITGGMVGESVIDWDYDDYEHSTDGQVVVVTKKINLIA